MESHGLTAMVPPYPPAADLSAFRDLRHQPKQKYSFFPVHSSCRIQPHGWRGRERSEGSRRRPSRGEVWRTWCLRIVNPQGIALH